MRALRPRAAGGKSGRLNDWRGIWAPWASDGLTGAPGRLAGFVVAIVGRVGPNQLIGDGGVELGITESSRRCRSRMDFRLGLKERR